MSVISDREHANPSTVIAHVEGLQLLADALAACQASAHPEAPNTDNVVVVCKEAEANMLEASQHFARRQSDVRMCASELKSEEMAAKIRARDAARALLCTELQSLLGRLAEPVCGKSSEPAKGKEALHGALDGARNRLKQLRSALEAARQCVTKYNATQDEPCAHMGASCTSSQVDEKQALELWQEWKTGAGYERIASATDTCMKAVHQACTESLGTLLSIDKQQPAPEHVRKMEDAVIAAGKAMDEEVALQKLKPASLAPVTPLTSAAERLVAVLEALVSALTRACELYDNIYSVLEMETKCLDVNGPRCTQKQQAIEDVKKASKAHKLARAKLMQEDVLAQSPELVEEKGITMDEVHKSMQEIRGTLKDAAQALREALMPLLEMQDYFPEVCMYIKTGLPQELFAVWRPDLTIEMFEVHGTMSSGLNHTVFKASMDGKTYALKEFRLATAQGLQDLMREAAMLRKMRHPAIVEIIGLFEGTATKDNKVILLQMPFFEHGSLDTWVDSEAPEWRAVRTVLLDIAGALEYLHSFSVLHCDVKPPNILVAANCRGRLADFDTSMDNVTRTSTRPSASRFPYTAGFDAPELSRFALRSVMFHAQEKTRNLTAYTARASCICYMKCACFHPLCRAAEGSGTH
jgi:serine/threonine protein kinase